jgi:hypothetical protein
MPLPTIAAQRNLATIRKTKTLTLKIMTPARLSFLVAHVQVSLLITPL